MMSGTMSLLSGASMTKASTNTTYTVTEGAARVNLSNITKTVRQEDEINSFFIPKKLPFLCTGLTIASLSMEGNLPSVKEEFAKRRCSELFCNVFQEIQGDHREPDVFGIASTRSAKMGEGGECGE
ncbi:hypothetical protein J6590_008976 [Homalodisca vitripennis]|nr:hypothetical protein J6590_008976 [Homalodisca vitripennis]